MYPSALAFAATTPSVTDRRRAFLQRWSHLLDTCFRVPGTNLRFGLDPVLGLFPAIGDLATPVFSCLLLMHAARLQVPRIVQLRMVLNVLIDAIGGMLPVIGDLFDAGWKANLRNLRLLERHARGERAPTGRDWAFVLAMAAALLVAAALPMVILTLMLARFGVW